MNNVMNGILLGLFYFGIILIIMYILRKYMNIANIIGGKIISYFRYLFHKAQKHE